MKIITCLLAMLTMFVFGVTAGDMFVQSDTYAITNAATATIAVTNYPTAGSVSMPWYAASIMLRAYDSATGAVLKVEHVRTGVSQSLQSTNGTISVTNELYSVTSTAAVTTVLWTGADYPVNPSTDSILISTSCTNGVLILNRNIER